MWLLLIIVLVCLVSKFLQQKPKAQHYHDQIEDHTLSNLNYRKVLATTNEMQLVLMSLKPKEDIGMEVHDHVSQFIRVEKGHGVAIIDGQQYPMNNGNIIVVPAGAQHNVINLSPDQRLQLYAIYAPPEHPPKTIQLNKPKDH